VSPIGSNGSTGDGRNGTSVFAHAVVLARRSPTQDRQNVFSRISKVGVGREDGRRRPVVGKLALNLLELAVTRRFRFDVAVSRRFRLDF